MANYPPYMNFQQPVYGYPYGQPGMTMPAVPPVQNYPSVQPVQPVQAAQAPSNTASQPGFVCRPVASCEEAKAVPTDFNGNMLVMTDFQHGAIYTKALDPATGSAQFVTYQRLSDQSNPTEKLQTPVNIPDYSPALNSIGDQINRMNGRIEELFEKLDGKQKAKQSGKEAV